MMWCLWHGWNSERSPAPPTFRFISVWCTDKYWQTDAPEHKAILHGIVVIVLGELYNLKHSQCLCFKCVWTLEVLYLWNLKWRRVRSSGRKLELWGDGAVLHGTLGLNPSQRNFDNKVFHLRDFQCCSVFCNLVLIYNNGVVVNNKQTTHFIFNF